MPVHVNCYFFDLTRDAPNNTLPVLHYRNVLPSPLTEQTATIFLTSNNWEKRGTWGHIETRHFHPNSNKCYGMFKGTSTLLLGSMSSDDGHGLTIDVEAGYVIVLPAGTAHSSIESSQDYRYIGLYPRGCPKWSNEVGKTPPEAFLGTISEVECPTTDPVYGEEAPLLRLWQPANLKRS